MDESSLAAAGFHAAPTWSTLAGLSGKGLVFFAIACFVASALLSATKKEPARLRLAIRLFALGSLSIAGSMVCLGALFVGDQFEYEYVASHSWKASAVAYKIAAIWSGQQGSFMLWAVASALFGILALRSTGVYKRAYIAIYASFLASLSAILAFESPFAILQKMVIGGAVYLPLDGMGLAPSLQNYWVVIHPPIIFLGFGSLTVPFAYSLSAMLTGDVRSWANQVRPWALTGMTLLGLGLVLGGQWAYETQGWGGFWAWDPVENVSLVPWLLMAALVHGLMVQVTRSKWHWANLLLGGAPFLLFVYGTFLTRSGYLDKFSVHSFAQMDRSALWILLGVVGTAFGGFIGVWIARGRKLASSLPMETAELRSPRESAFQAGALLLALLALSVAVGMSVPFLLGLLGKDAKVVDEPLYHDVVVWFFVPILVLMSGAPFLSWRSMEWKELSRRSWFVLGIALLIESAIIFALHNSDWPNVTDGASRITFPAGISVPRTPWVLTLTFFAALAVAGNSWRAAELFRRSKLGTGGLVTHVGVALTLAGLILSRGLEQKQQVLVMDGTPGTALGYTVRFDRLTSNPAADPGNKAVFSISRPDGSRSAEALCSYFLTPGAVGDEVFTSPSIQRYGSHDLYLALESPQANLWDQPEEFMLGETKSGSGVAISFLGLSMHGKSGEPDSWVGAKLKVVEDGKEYFGEPKVDRDGKQDTPAVSPSLKATISGFNPETGSIKLQMPYVHTLYPLLLFYKPLTALIWIGIFVMTVGGFMAAAARARTQREAQAST